jgi:hypothetical protein
VERESGASGLNEIEAGRRKRVKLLVVAARRHQKQEASCPVVARDSKRVLNSPETSLSRFIQEILCKNHDFIPVVPPPTKISTFSHCIIFHIIHHDLSNRTEAHKAMQFRVSIGGIKARIKTTSKTRKVSLKAQKTTR